MLKTLILLAFFGLIKAELTAEEEEEIVLGKGLIHNYCGYTCPTVVSGERVLAYEIYLDPGHPCPKVLKHAKVERSKWGNPCFYKVSNNNRRFISPF